MSLVVLLALVFDTRPSYFDLPNRAIQHVTSTRAAENCFARPIHTLIAAHCSCTNVVATRGVNLVALSGSDASRYPPLRVGADESTRNPQNQRTRPPNQR